MRGSPATGAIHSVNCSGRAASAQRLDVIMPPAIPTRTRGKTLVVTDAAGA
ncbi:MAG: hypothetical protein AAF961_18250 [Planctomycetota bacterium]